MNSTGIRESCICLVLSFLTPGIVGATVVPLSGHTVESDCQGARSVRMADLDADGDLDIVAAASFEGHVAWYENTAGDASAWDEHVLSSTGANANAIALADIDGDGDIDVVASLGGTGEDGAVYWWENNGASHFAWTEHLVNRWIDLANWVEAADVDGDGDTDLVGVALSEQAVHWWENDGSPDSGLWPEHTLIDTFNGAWSATAADLDHDGDTDILATAIFENMIAWWENDGATPTPAWTVRMITDTFTGAHGAVAADIDNDGDLDVVGSGLHANEIAWWESDGSPANGGWTKHSVGTSFTFAYDVWPEDVDADGDLDIVGAASSAGLIAWWENDGTPADGGWLYRLVGSGVDGAASVRTGDLDGDGDTDFVAAARTDNEVRWWKNGTIHRTAAFPTVGESIIDAAYSGQLQTSIDVADLDRDGNLDVVGTANDAQDIVWWRNDGSPWVTGWAEYSVTGGVVADARSIVTADVDGDGDVDIINSGETSPGVGWWENDGTPVDGGWIQHTAWASAVRNMAAGDVDADGDVDLFIRILSGDGCYFLDNRVVAFGTWTLFDIDGVGCTAPPSAADLDADGKLDLLSAGHSNWVTWWENNYPVGHPSTWWIEHTIHETAIVSASSADIDDDGDLDVLALTTTSVKIFENDGSPLDGGWVEHEIGTHSGTDKGTIEGLDLDADGDLDLLTMATTFGDVLWFENDGTPFDGAWSAENIAHEFDGVLGVLAADVDNSGHPDVVAAADDLARLTWWQNRGGQFALPTTWVVPSVIEDYQTVLVFKITMMHLGRPGDPDEELANLALLFESEAGVPLTSSQANALLSNLLIYRDNGDGVFNIGIDPLLTTVGTLSLVDGFQTVTFTDGDPNFQVELGSSKQFFVVIQTTSNASSQSPNTLRITHVTDPMLHNSYSTAEDRDHDLPLTVMGLAEKTTPVISIVNPMIFADGFESGQTNAWDSVTP